MTKDRLRRFFELQFDLEERGRLDPSNSPETPRANEYYHLVEEYDNWDPEAVWDNGASLARAHEEWGAAMDDNTNTIHELNKSWNKLCRFWKDRAKALEEQLNG